MSFYAIQRLSTARTARGTSTASIASPPPGRSPTGSCGSCPSPTQNREIRLDSAGAREYGGQNATELHQVRKPLSLMMLALLDRFPLKRLRISRYRSTSSVAVMPFSCLLCESSSAAWLLGLTLLLTKLIQSNEAIFGTTSHQFMSPPAIVSANYLPFAMQTTMRSPTLLHCLQCYHMISSSSPLPSLFARRADTPTACSIITLSTILTSLPTSTSSFCTPTALSPF